MTSDSDSGVTPALPPLCVDLDGTLVAADTLHLSILRLARQRPLAAAVLPLVVWRGRAAFKRFVSDRVSLDASGLPYRVELLDFLRAERASGRRLYLTTAADARVAAAVAAHLGLFDDVIASDGQHNAKGLGKVEAIRAYFGPGEFDYIGDSLADLPVFLEARRSYLVCPSDRLRRRVEGNCRVERVFERRREP